MENSNFYYNYYFNYSLFNKIIMYNRGGQNKCVRELHGQIQLY